jgi:Ca-activated chloride channel family protein
MKHVFWTIAVTMISLGASAQQVNSLLKKGNDAYKKQQYTEAAGAYQSALSKAPASEIGQYNLGNAFYRGKKLDEAAEAYEKAARTTPAPDAAKARGAAGAAGAADSKIYRQQAYYNEGVALQQQKKLPECIDAYKNALKLDPADQDARFNLQRALQQQKQDQQQQQQQKKNQPQNQKQKQQQKQQQKQDQQQQQQQQNKLTRQQADQLLKTMEQKEKDLQDKMEKVHGNPQQPEKDW